MTAASSAVYVPALVRWPVHLDLLDTTFLPNAFFTEAFIPVVKC